MVKYIIAPRTSHSVSATFRFMVGLSCIIVYFMTLVNLIEKFAEIWEKGEDRFESQSLF